MNPEPRPQRSTWRHSNIDRHGGYLYLAAAAGIWPAGSRVGYLAVRRRGSWHCAAAAARSTGGRAEVIHGLRSTGQGARVLEAAILEQPTNVNAKLTLVKIYGKQNDKVACRRIARDLQPVLMQNELLLWEKVARLGLKMDPDNGLYQPTVSQLQQQA